MPDKPFSLTHQFLISMPALIDPFFSQSVIYICEHTHKGAIGLVINHPLPLNLSQVLKQMEITIEDQKVAAQTVLCGGPVHPERGFVIHTPSGEWQSSLRIASDICVTVSEDILSAVARNQGPEQVVFSLGYANWMPGQLEDEIQRDYWLTLPVNLEILFHVPFEKRWRMAMRQLGINTTELAPRGGQA